MRAKRNLLWLMPSSVLAVVAATLAATDHWRLAGVLPLGTYVDLAQVTSNASCRVPGAGQVGSTACDLFGRPYNYPPVWTSAFRALGLGASSTAWLGTALVTAGLLALAAFFMRFAGRPTPGRVLVLTVLTCSPPTLLLIARANTDLVPLVLLVAGALLVESGAGAWAAPLFALAAGLKLWPVGALVALRDRRSRWWGAALAVLSVGALAAPHLRAIRAATPSTTHTTFGVGVLPAVARDRGWAQIHGRDQAVGLVVFLAVVVALVAVPVVRHALQSTAESLRASPTAATAHLLGAGTSLATYLFTSSFDYRMTPLLFVAAACLAVGGPGARALLALLVVAFWSGATRSPAQLVGDVALLVAMPATAVVTLELLRSQGRPAVSTPVRREAVPAGHQADTIGRTAA